LSVKDTQVNTPSVGGVHTKVLLTTSSPTLLNENSKSNVHAASSLIPSYDITQPRPNRVTRQLPGEDHAAFFERTEAFVCEAYAKGNAIQLAKWDARRDKHKSLDCPDKTGDPAVFQWEENENGEEIRLYVGHKLWRRCFQSSSPSQRRYNPVHNEFDICEFLDPTAQHNSDGDCDDHFVIADDTPITNSGTPNPPVETSALSHAPTVSITHLSLPPHDAVSAKSRSTSDLSHSRSYSPRGESLTSHDSYECRSRRSKSIHKCENYRDHRYQYSRSRSPARDCGHRTTTRERCSSPRQRSQPARNLEDREEDSELPNELQVGEYSDYSGYSTPMTLADDITDVESVGATDVLELPGLESISKQAVNDQTIARTLHDLEKITPRLSQISEWLKDVHLRTPGPNSDPEVTRDVERASSVRAVFHTVTQHLDRILEEVNGQSELLPPSRLQTPPPSSGYRSRAMYDILGASPEPLTQKRRQSWFEH
jgi:hypothetical protein